MTDACDICGAKATTVDGIVDAVLCSDSRCLDTAWMTTEWRKAGK